MVYAGSILMVFNIYGFVRFARYIRSLKGWDTNNGILYIPIVLLSFFLLGYLGVGIFGNPDLLVAGILFGGSIFVFIVYKLLSNITQRVVENEHREAQLKAVAESDRTKSTILASMSHEMRTPLNVILGLNNKAQKDPHLEDETRECLAKINLSARHLLGLVNNMLDMNRIESGTLTLKNEEFSMREALEQVDALGQTLCVDKGLTYTTRVDEEILGHYLGDETQLTQVLLSILDNAAKFTSPPGSVEFVARSTASTESSQALEFSISDTGEGMGEEFLPKIFQAFSREDGGATSRHGGGGLSLAVAKNVMDAMGGTIDIQSHKGKGTTVVVTVTLARAESPEASAQTPEDVSLEGRRILVVEDIEDNAEIVMDLLELEGAECEHAQNGQVAVDMFAQSPAYHYDAVLMDLRMPVMDGLEATRRIKALARPDAPTVPIIALTANAFESDVEQSLASGMCAHLAKPTDTEVLYATLRTYISQALGQAGGTR